MRFIVTSEITVDVHLDVYESISFKRGVISTIRLYISILVQLTLTFIQGLRSARKQNSQRQLSYKVFDQLEWCWYTVET